MRTEIFSGLTLSQLGAAALHLAVLVGIQRGLGRLAKILEVDRLALLNDRSTKTAVVRALVTRFDLWIWGYGLYTLLAWHFNGVLASAFGQGWASPTTVGDAAGNHYSRSQSVGRQVDLCNKRTIARFGGRRFLSLGRALLPYCARTHCKSASHWSPRFLRLAVLVCRAPSQRVLATSSTRW